MTTTTTLPPIGSTWVHKKDPHDIVVVTGYNTIAPEGDDTIKNNVVKVHRVKTNTPTIEITNTFTWAFKPLETMETP